MCFHCTINIFFCLRIVKIFYIEMKSIIIFPLKLMEIFFPLNFLLSSRVFRNELKSLNKKQVY